MEYKNIDLETLNSGAVLDLFSVEWQKLLNNINDPNTKPNAARKVTIEIAVLPAKDRRNATTRVSVTSKLAAVTPHESFIVLGEEDGELHAYTFDPKQQGLNFDDEEKGDEKVTHFPKAQ